MPLLVRCPSCKKLLAASAKTCRSKTGKGCGAKIPAGMKHYYLQWMGPDGRTHQKSIGHLLAKEARLKEAMAMNDIAQGQKPFEGRKEKITFNQFIDSVYQHWCDQYNSSPATKRHRLSHIKREWGPKKLSALTDRDIDKYRWKMKQSGKKATFNRVITVLSHLFTIAMERGYLKEKPIRTAKKKFRERGRLRYLSAEEAKRLVDACTPYPYLRPIVVTALNTGLRRGELLGLRLGENADLEGRRITLYETKNGEGRHVALNDNALEALREATMGKEPGDLVFTKPDGGPCNTVRYAFEKACERAGLVDFHFHDLRHCFASHLAMSGIDLNTIRELLGHKDMSMVMRYAHLSPEHQRRAVEALDRAYEPPEPPTSISSISVGARPNRDNYRPYGHELVVVGK
ncbi:MAG: tyrosine-type recombinase/integrase [Pseudomonadota bacterium]